MRATSAPAEHNPATRAASSIGPESRVSRPTTTFRASPAQRTSPAARPNARTRSGVRSLFATPRMPSVPKSLVTAPSSQVPGVGQDTDVSPVTQVEIAAHETDRFEDVLAPERYEELVDTIVRALELFDNRIVWNVNSTARGGGVAEMLQSLLAYARGAGVDARWAVIEGDPDFFKITKRIHNHLHGAPGDGGPLGQAEHRA